MAREDLHFRLRIPEYLKELVEKAANEKGHSMTAEIVRRLHVSFDEDYVTLKMPRGLQERIRRYAERHQRAFDDEIIRVLDREYPEPWSVDGRVADLMDMLAILKGGVTDERIDRLTHEIEETVLGMMTGRVRGVDEQALKNIDYLWSRYQEDLADRQRDLAELDEEEEEQLAVSGRTEKFEPPRPDRKRLGSLSDQEFEVYRLGYDAGLKAQHEPTVQDEDPFEDDE